MIKKMILFLIFCLIVYLWIAQIIPMGIAILRTSIALPIDFPKYTEYWFESIEWSEQTSSWQVTYRNGSRERLVLDAEIKYLPVLAGQEYRDAKAYYDHVYQKDGDTLGNKITDAFEQDTTYKGGPKKNYPNNATDTSSTSNVTKSSDAVYNLNRD